jgi:hypothetical protein
MGECRLSASNSAKIIWSISIKLSMVDHLRKMSIHFDFVLDTLCKDIN